MEICLGAAEVKSQPRDSSASLTPIQLSHSPYSRFVSGKKIDFTCNSRGHEMEEEFANFLPSTLRTEFPYFSVSMLCLSTWKKVRKRLKAPFPSSTPRSNFSGSSGGLGVAEDHHPPQGCAQAHSHPSLP